MVYIDGNNHNEQTCSWGGSGPGSMSLADEYNLGMCLSWLQRMHSAE